MRHTPVQLEVLIQAHYIADYVPNKSPAVNKAIEKWLKFGMIQKAASNLSTYYTTRKGKFFIDHLCSLRLPVEESCFHIPTGAENEA